MIWVYNLIRIERVIDLYDLNYYRGTHVSAGSKISVKLRKIIISMAIRSTNHPAKTYILIPFYTFFEARFFAKAYRPYYRRLWSDFMATDLQHVQASRFTWLVMEADLQAIWFIW
jgi:hypothetical protein